MCVNVCVCMCDVCLCVWGGDALFAGCSAARHVTLFYLFCWRVLCCVRPTRPHALASNTHSRAHAQTQTRRPCLSRATAGTTAAATCSCTCYSASATPTGRGGGGGGGATCRKTTHCRGPRPGPSCRPPCSRPYVSFDRQLVRRLVGLVGCAASCPAGAEVVSLGGAALLVSVTSPSWFCFPGGGKGRGEELLRAAADGTADSPALHLSGCFPPRLRIQSTPRRVKALQQATTFPSITLGMLRMYAMRVHSGRARRGAG